MSRYALPRPFLLGLALLGAALAPALIDRVESMQGARTNAPPHPSPRAAPGISASAAVAPRASTATGTALIDRFDPVSVRGRLDPRESESAVRVVRAFAPSPAKSSPAGETLRSAEAFETVAKNEVEGAMGPVARLYLAYFQRLPDFEGFEYYIVERDDGRPLADIADEFAGSREFAERYGALDNPGFLDRIARNVDSEIDPEQRAQWLSQLDAGVVTRGQVLLALSESDGFREDTANEVFAAIEDLLRTRKPR